MLAHVGFARWDEMVTGDAPALVAVNTVRPAELGEKFEALFGSSEVSKEVFQRVEFHRSIFKQWVSLPVLTAYKIEGYGDRVVSHDGSFFFTSAI